MKNVFKIQPGKDEDIRDLVNVDTKAFGKGIDAITLESQINIFPNGLFVVRVGNKLVGMAAFEKHKNKNFPYYCHNVKSTHKNAGELGYISIITLLEKYRGQGLGSLLLKKIENTAKKEGCHTLYCPVNQNHPYKDKGIFKFWEKNGFRIFGEIKWELSKDRIRRAYVFEKRL